MMMITLASDRRIADVFGRFSSGEAGDYGFSRTHVPMELAQFGDSNLISRSQAKRVLARLDRFDEIMLDFKGIKLIGQGFADELFRVFAQAHPSLKLVVINANDDVWADDPSRQD